MRRATTRGLVLAVAALLSTPAACTYEVPGVVTADASGGIDSSVADIVTDGSPESDGPGMDSLPMVDSGPGDAGPGDTSVSDSMPSDVTVPSDTATPDSGADADGAVSTSCAPGGITWKETTSLQVTGTALTLPAPASLAAGDLLLAYLAAYVGSGGPGQTMDLTVPQGWTLQGGGNQTGYYSGSSSLAVYSRIATASEPGSYVWTSNQSVEVVAWILDYTGVNPTNPIDTHSAGAQDLFVDPFPTPSITTSGPNELLIATFTGTAEPPATGWSVPQGLTQRASVVDGTKLAGASDDKLKAAAGTAGPFDSAPAGISDVDVNTVVTHIVALRPCL
jgi:hypothetical protein